MSGLWVPVHLMLRSARCGKGQYRDDVSSLLFPVGPERPSVYWLRRLVLLVAVGTLILGVWFLLGGRGSSEPTTGSEPSANSEPSAAPTASFAIDDSSTSIEPSALASIEASAPADETGVVETPTGEPIDCGDDVITVDGTSDASTYRLGSNPVLTLTITNIGDLPCLRDVGPKANEIEVTSGGYHVWSSDDCNASDKSKVVTLQPGETVSSSITWSGVLSRKGCPEIDREAKPGRYEVVGRNGKVRSDGTPFSLTRDS